MIFKKHYFSSEKTLLTYQQPDFKFRRQELPVLSQLKKQEALLLFKRPLQLTVLTGLPQMNIFSPMLWEIKQVCPPSSIHKSTFLNGKLLYINTAEDIINLPVLQHQ